MPPPDSADLSSFCPCGAIIPAPDSYTKLAQHIRERHNTTVRGMMEITLNSSGCLTGTWHCKVCGTKDAVRLDDHCTVHGFGLAHADAWNRKHLYFFDIETRRKYGMRAIEHDNERIDWERSVLDVAARRDHRPEEVFVPLVEGEARVRARTSSGKPGSSRRGDQNGIIWDWVQQEAEPFPDYKELVRSGNALFKKSEELLAKCSELIPEDSIVWQRDSSEDSAGGSVQAHSPAIREEEGEVAPVQDDSSSDCPTSSSEDE